MKRLALLLILALTALSVQAQPSVFDSKNSTSSVSLSSAYVSLADDPSAIFINPGGLVQLDKYELYTDSNGGVHSHVDRSARVAGTIKLKQLVLAGGLYYGFDKKYNQSRTSLAIAYTFLKGTVGSFLSGGLSFDYMTASGEGVSTVGNGGDSDRIFTVSIGTMIRPLPVVSLALSILNLPDISPRRFNANYWKRCMLWGVSYFWREKVTILYEQEIIEREVTHHYGFVLKTASPIELMSGFSNGRIAGGVRWRGSFFNISCAFISNKSDPVTYSVSVEIMRKAKGKDAF